MKPSSFTLRDRRISYRALLAQLDEVRTKIERAFETAENDTDDIIPEDCLPRPIAWDKVRKVIKLRSRRRRIFGPGIFGEPAWDMLLDLYSATLEGRAESVSSVAVASGAPPTTALRWIMLLEESGWVVREPDPNDGRRVLVSLSPRARSAMDLFFNQPELEGL